MNQDYRLGPRLSDEWTGTLDHVLGLHPAGHALEFGVGQGHSLRRIAAVMPAVGFDSFKGLPENWREGFEAGTFACDPPDVDAPLVVGMFADTLPGFAWCTCIGLVHLDADLYSSTKTVLEHVGPYLHPGCYIVFDEYHGYPLADAHEQLAWREYAAASGICWEVIGHGPEQWAIRVTGRCPLPAPEMRRVVLFCMAGRRPNMELHVPFIRRVLLEHPNVEYHLWDISRTQADSDYLKTVTGCQITHLNHLFDLTGNPWSVARFNQVMTHYTDPAYRDCLFVKIDDDVVFCETDRFGEYLDAIAAHPGAVISANVINNGACSQIDPYLKATVARMGLTPASVHTSPGVAAAAHNYFLDNSHRLLGQPVELVDTDDYLSINLIGYDWATGRRLVDLFGKPNPPTICGYTTNREEPVNDESAVNMLGRKKILRGFTACHLTFGWQHITDADQAAFRKRYAQANNEYRRETT